MSNPTRERCGRCGTRGWGFYSPHWREWLNGSPHEHNILCVQCFAEICDEKNLPWEDGLKIQPCSIKTHHGLIESGEWAGSLRTWIEGSN